MIKIPGHIKSLQPYKAGKPIEELAREKKLSRIVKLASNENPLGPSPKAMDAIEAVISDGHRYVDPSAFELVHKIAAHYSIEPQRIICGAGTDSLLAYIIQAFTSENDEILTSVGTFIGIYVNVKKQNRSLKLISQNNYNYDLDKIIDSITPATKIIYIANPNNPTGSMVSKIEFDNFYKRVPSDILIILDEAYYSYASLHDDYPDGLKYDYENLIVTRTFSKDFGLAGYRVGFAYATSELITELYKVKLPFEPSNLAQAAAIASLDDQGFLCETVELNQKMLSRMKSHFDSLSLTQIETAANFILLLFSNADEALRFSESCLNHGLIVRHVPAFGIENGVRINSGTEEETEFALDVITQVCKELEINKVKI